MKQWLTALKPYLILIPVSLLYAICFNWCFAPNGIAYGGFTGIAQVVHYFLPVLGVGTIIILMNIPVFVIGWKYVSRKFTVISAWAMLLTSILIDVVANLYTFTPMDPLLACIYGGVLLGITIGSIASLEGSTGGTDLAARLLKLKISWLPVGRLMMGLDLAVILLVATVFGDLNSALYGGVALYIATMVVDVFLYGMDRSQLAYIISDHHDAISKAIMEEIDRGITVLDGRGGFTGDNKQVILVAFKQRQIVRIKQTVRSIDPKAFLILCAAHEVMGSGFRSGDTVGY